MTQTKPQMTDQHRATPEQWRYVKALADVATYSTIHELLCRIEALEAAQPAQPNHPAKPDSSLKGRIKSRMIDGIGSGNPMLMGTWEETSASVLVEVAAWLRETSHYYAADLVFLLEQEAER